MQTTTDAFLHDVDNDNEIHFTINYMMNTNKANNLGLSATLCFKTKLPPLSEHSRVSLIFPLD